MKKIILLTLFGFIVTGCAALQESLDEASRSLSKSSKNEMPYSTYERIARWEAVISECHGRGFIDNALADESLSVLAKARNSWSYDESVMRGIKSEIAASISGQANMKSCANVKDLSRNLIVDSRISNQNRARGTRRW